MGPLAGIRVVEFEGIGPAPYCGMLLADLGAEVVRVARPHAERGPLIQHAGDEPIDRGRTTVTLDLKSPDGRDGALALLDRADALIEGLRPGVMERLGLGPDGGARPQSAAGLRPDHRLGAGGAVGDRPPGMT